RILARTFRSQVASTHSHRTNTVRRRTPRVVQVRSFLFETEQTNGVVGRARSSYPHNAVPPRYRRRELALVPHRLAATIAALRRARRAGSACARVNDVASQSQSV